MPKDKYFLPLESSLYVRRGVNKIRDADDRATWCPELILEEDLGKNPNDVFIIPESERNPQNRAPERRAQNRRQGPQRYPKIRIFVDTYEWKIADLFLDCCNNFAEFCKKKKITVFGMIYGLFGDKDHNTGLFHQRQGVKIQIKKGEAQINNIEIRCRQVQRVKNKDLTEYDIENWNVQNQNQRRRQQQQQQQRRLDDIPDFNSSDDNIGDDNDPYNFDNLDDSNPESDSDDGMPRHWDGDDIRQAPANESDSDQDAMPAPISPPRRAAEAPLRRKKKKKIVKKKKVIKSPKVQNKKTKEKINKVRQQYLKTHKKPGLEIDDGWFNQNNNNDDTYEWQNIDEYMNDNYEF